jgi:hypothetical protein
MLIMKGAAYMKYLKIDNNMGYFSLDGENWKPIDEINKEHLLSLVDLSLSDNFEMDDFDKTKLGHKAHQVIYKNIFDKLLELNDKKDRFKDESESLYKEAIEKYSQ